MGTLVTRANERIPEKVEALSLREQLPVLLLLTGAVSILLLAGDVIGHTHTVGFAELHWKQFALMGFSALLLGSAVALDLSLGQKRILTRARAASRDLENVGRFAGITLELGLLVAIIREFRIANAAFSQVIALLTFIGFVLHHFLPKRYRSQFFLLLSLIGIWSVFGTINTVWLVGICLLMIGLCHLPVPFKARVALVLLAGGIMALCRAGKIHGPWPSVVWPIVGSILMFRMIVYLYDLQHWKGKINIPITLSYFFLLPNVVFPLFPVVDYKTFTRSWYDRNQYEIYQRGIQWIFRGVTHLILYRLVYKYFIVSPTDIATIPQLLRYIYTSFALYLDVSGSFHLIIGVLHLFGFYLPETNHKYFLSASFNDIWRRTNIYWKDFMMKVFYYPAYFRLRRLGNTAALILATLFIFVVTWFLHAYQWFWLRGAFFTSPQDLLFWTLLGVLVLGSSLYEMNFGRKRSLGKAKWSIRTVVPQVFRVAGTMTVLCALWSLWTSTSISEWISLWYLPGRKLTAAGLGSFSNLMVLGLAAGATSGVTRLGTIQANAGSSNKPRSFARSVIPACLLFVLIFLGGKPEIYSHFGNKAATLIGGLASDSLNARDAAIMQRSYYEDLKVERFDSSMWDLYQKIPADWKPIGETSAARQTNDFEWLELRPNASIVLKGALMHVNRWGMRDQDYTKEKPAGTYRYAMVGASVSMGTGVGDGQDFESLIERRLNSEKDPHSHYSKYEILNFSVGGYSPLQYLWVIEHKVYDFQPDALLYVAHGNHDEERTVYFMSKFVRSGVDLQYDYLRQIARNAGVDRNTPSAVAIRRLQPYGKQMLAWIYQRIVQDCRERGIIPVSVYLQALDEQQMPLASAPRHIRMAQQAGFVTVDVVYWYKEQEMPALKIAAWDSHPNPRGHQLIADALYEALKEKSKTVPLGFPCGIIDTMPVKAAGAAMGSRTAPGARPRG
jgi:hypothetical protein